MKFKRLATAAPALITRERAYHTGTLRRTITIGAPRRRVWAVLSRVADMSWAAGVADTAPAGARTGRGAARRIRFTDGKVVREVVTGWKGGDYISYIALDGLPLRAYHATVSLRPRGTHSTHVEWESYFNSERMTGAEFSGFVTSLGAFYHDSLSCLKARLEGRTT